jgi:hypothetical protein
MSNHDHLADPVPTPQESELLRLVRGLRFGQVVVQVHDGRLVQIERTERYRTDHRADQRDLGRAS